MFIIFTIWQQTFDELNKTITVEPGVVRDELNLFLKPFGLFFGPNTSTSNRCMIGGMVGNNSSGSTSIESLIENKDLDELKKRKDEYVNAMNAMKVELNEINSGIAFLDENERLTLVSKYEIEEQVFTSYIEAQANLKTRKNILILQ